MISGFVTLGKEKMSKSKGNVINPNDVMKKYGNDSLRFWAAGSKLGEDLAYNEKDLLTGKKFLTKLWNASRFSLMNLENYKEKNVNLEPFDKLFLIKMNKFTGDHNDLKETLAELKQACDNCNSKVFGVSNNLFLVVKNSVEVLKE